MVQSLSDKGIGWLAGLPNQKNYCETAKAHNHKGPFKDSRYIYIGQSLQVFLQCECNSRACVMRNDLGTGTLS